MTKLFNALLENFFEGTVRKSNNDQRTTRKELALALQQKHNRKRVEALIERIAVK